MNKQILISKKNPMDSPKCISKTRDVIDGEEYFHEYNNFRKHSIDVSRSMMM